MVLAERRAASRFGSRAACPVTASSQVDGGTAGAASPVASECTRAEVRAQAAEPVRANVQARVNTTAGA